IPLRRGKSDKNAIRLIKNEIEKGELIGMFPEGTRTKDGSLMHFHTGAARLCLEYNIPYIPVGITGSYKTKMGDKINVHIGKPRYPNGMALTYENAKKFTELMRQDIQALCGVKDTPIIAEVAQMAQVSPVPSSNIPLKAPEQIIHN
ncbi:MAG: 1-acyl-sn-glycerol-3-phosphate acyltransferase, partial [Candidatus Heimdallarchaeota archaeon]|nr:1-acyl-sn-glycerol-3-phosphate acyltransferase [Candidatus Heimdallarchaeota archaeon]